MNRGFEQDATGQWWYRYSDGRRFRAKMKTCEECGAEYAAYHHAASQKFCSRACFGKSRRGVARPRGPRGYRWSGGRVESRGYVMIHSPDHPSIADRAWPRNSYVFEHRLVMEKKLGRYLETEERVHHRNGVRDDNRPENLELWVGVHPKGKRLDDPPHCPTCTCGEH